MAASTLKQLAYSSIKEKIINCVYEPGMFLNEERLREETSMSRTPIRDALSRLEQEGLIKILPKKGIMVSNLTISDVNMIFEVRFLFEPYSLRNYGHTMDEAVLMDFYHRFSHPDATLDDKNFFALDDSFHDYIINSVPNTYIRQTYSLIHNQNLRFRVLTGQRGDQRLSETCREHLDIVSACIQKDWDKAADKMTRHLVSSKNSTFNLILNQQNAIL